MRRTIVVVTLLLASTAVADQRVCGYNRAMELGLRGILAAPPDKATPAFIAQAWAVDLPWGSRDGTLSTFSHLAYVLDDECLCCDSFTFENDSGADRLTTISLSRFQKSRKSAVALAQKLTASASGKTAQESEPPFTTTAEIAVGITQTTQATVEKVSAGWRIHLLVSRIRY